MELFYTALTLVAGGLVALLIGIALGRQSRPAPLPQAPAPEEPEEEETPEDPHLHSIAVPLEELASKFASPDAFLSSPPFAEALQQVAALALSPSDLLGFIRHSGPVAASLAIRHAVSRKDLDPERLHAILLDRLESTSLLDRTVVLQALEETTDTPLVGEIIKRLDSDWQNGAAVETLELFLRQRLLRNDSFDLSAHLKDKDSWDLDQIREVLQRLPEDLRKPLLEHFPKPDPSATNFRDFLSAFATILPEIKDSLPDGSPLLESPFLLEATAKVAGSLTNAEHPRSVLLTGTQGVGKTALTQLIARQLQAEGYLVIRASAADLMSGQSYIGEIEKRVQTLVTHLREQKLVWIADSFHELGISGRHRHSPTSILDMLLPHLQAGAIRILGETRPASLERLAHQVPRLDTALDITRFEEASEAETLALAAQWINHHPGRQGCKPASTTESLAEGLRLCSQFLPTQSRPGNLIDLLKHSFPQEIDRHPGQPTASLRPQAFLTSIASISGMPLEIIDDARRLDLDALRQRFDKRVVGQSEAVGALLERVAMIKAGLTDPTRPLGVFLFAGPTGTGKTEIAKALADFLFGSAKRMIRLDMSEFKNPSALSRLNGGPDEGQSLASQIRQQPFSLILLDEFEKADPNVWDLFLQVFDDGRLTDAQGNTADLRNAIIILTSNLGATSAQGNPLGFVEDSGPRFHPEAIQKTIEDTFRKEFVNRIDRIVCFQPLSRDTMRQILRQQVAQVLLRRGLRRRPWTIEWDPTATEFLLEKGFSPTMGARPLQRAVERYFLSPLAHAIVHGDLADDEQLLFIYAKDGALRWDSSNEPIPDADERGIDETPSAPSSNRHLILRPDGSEDELRFLLQRQEDLTQLLSLDAFHERKQTCLHAMSHPDFWNREDRFETLGLAEYIDRIESNLRATGEFLSRLVHDPSRRPSPDRLRALVARHAERLFLLESAYPEITAPEPAFDALLAIQPHRHDDKSATFADTLRDMYQAWAKQRGMRLEVIAPANKDVSWLANISGFGAYHILQAEAGTHHWLEGRLGEVAATVLVTPANRLPQPVSSETPPLVRRYQELPTPLVRDKIANWRTGRLDLVLQGHFDIIGS